MNSPSKTKEELLALTKSLPDDAFFLEYSRTRELAYIERSFPRWMEIIGIALSKLQNMERLSCLDIGASPFSFLLQGWFGKVSALDLSDALRKRCEAAGMQFYSGGVNSSQTMAGLEKIECIFCLEVLEHLHSDPIEVLKGLRSALRPRGLLILSTPNMMCFANRVLMLCNRKLRHFTYPPFAQNDRTHGHAHDRVYMPMELKEYCLASGFEVVETLYQRNFDAMAHANDNLAGRFMALGPRTLKLAFPSLRDGVIMVARNSAGSAV